MKTFRAMLLRVAGMFNKERRDHELDEELKSHLHMQIDENLRSGMSRQEAERAAYIRLGAVESAKETYREQRGIPILENLWQDLRFGARTLLRSPGPALVAILTLGLGIGANTAIFSAVHAVLLKPLPYENGDRIVTLRQQAPRAGFLDVAFSVPELTDYRAQNHTLDAIVEYHNMAFILLGRKEPERVLTGVVSWNFFDVFGLKPLLGRPFRAEDEQPGAPPVLLLSYDYWIHSFGGDPTVVGKTYRMNDKLHTVVGVLPPVPQFPDENDVYMPTTACPFRSDPMMMANRKDRMMQAFGLLKPGISDRQAQADLSGVATNLQKSYADVYPANLDYSVRASLLREEMTQDARPTMLVLLGTAGFVLLIACANVTNLNLARMVGRQRELAIRTALGANRARLFRQLLTESLLLTIAGATVGWLFASSGIGLLAAYISRFTPRGREIQMDGTVLLFTLVVAVLVSLVSGSIAALDQRRESIGNLKDGSAQSTIGRGRQRLRNGLIVAQIAVSFVLLIGAGLMLRSFVKLQHVDAGFEPSNVLTMRVNLDFAKYNTSDKQRAFFENLLQKVKAQAGVVSAAVSMVFPLNGAGPVRSDFTIEGRLHDQNMPIADFRIVSPDYFKTLKIPVLSGRAFTDSDRPGSQDVALVSRTAGRHFWKDQDPIGKRISTDSGKTWAQIVGVVGDVKQYGLDKDAADEIYYSLAQSPMSGASLLVKTAGDPMSIARLAVGLIYQIDPNQPAARIRSLDQVRADSIAAPRLTTNLLGLFALLALVIAAAGIGGVMALSVNQRTQEIGVRMAIGAWPTEILRMVLGQGMLLAGLGVVLGLLGAMALTGALRKVLFEVNPIDPLTFLSVAVVLSGTAFLACYLPARRAAAVDPMIALRYE